MCCNFLSKRRNKRKRLKLVRRIIAETGGNTESDQNESGIELTENRALHSEQTPFDTAREGRTQDRASVHAINCEYSLETV